MESASVEMDVSSPDGDELKKYRNKEDREKSAIASHAVRQHLANFILSRRPSQDQADTYRSSSGNIIADIQLEEEEIYERSRSSMNSSNREHAHSNRICNPITRSLLAKTKNDHVLRKTASLPTMLSSLKAQSASRRRQVERRTTMSPIMKRKIKHRRPHLEQASSSSTEYSSNPSIDQSIRLACSAVRSPTPPLLHNLSLDSNSNLLLSSKGSKQSYQALGKNFHNASPAINSAMVSNLIDVQSFRASQDPNRFSNPSKNNLEESSHMRVNQALRMAVMQRATSRGVASRSPSSSLDQELVLLASQQNTTQDEKSNDSEDETVRNGHNSTPNIDNNEPELAKKHLRQQHCEASGDQPTGSIQSDGDQPVGRQLQFVSTRETGDNTKIKQRFSSSSSSISSLYPNQRQFVSSSLDDQNAQPIDLSKHESSSARDDCSIASTSDLQQQQYQRILQESFNQLRLRQSHENMLLQKHSCQPDNANLANMDLKFPMKPVQLGATRVVSSLDNPRTVRLDSLLNSVQLTNQSGASQFVYSSTSERQLLGYSSFEQPEAFQQHRDPLREELSLLLAQYHDHSNPYGSQQSHGRQSFELFNRWLGVYSSYERQQQQQQQQLLEGAAAPHPFNQAPNWAPFNAALENDAAHRDHLRQANQLHGTQTMAGFFNEPIKHQDEMGRLNSLRSFDQQQQHQNARMETNQSPLLLLPQAPALNSSLLGREALFLDKLNRFNHRNRMNSMARTLSSPILVSTGPVSSTAGTTAASSSNQAGTFNTRGPLGSNLFQFNPSGSSASASPFAKVVSQKAEAGPNTNANVNSDRDSANAAGFLMSNADRTPNIDSQRRFADDNTNDADDAKHDYTDCDGNLVIDMQVDDDQQQQANQASAIKPGGRQCEANQSRCGASASLDLRLDGRPARARVSSSSPSSLICNRYQFQPSSPSSSSKQTTTGSAANKLAKLGESGSSSNYFCSLHELETLRVQLNFEPKFNQQSSTGITFDRRLCNHRCICGKDENHPENGFRVLAIWARLYERGLIQRCARVPSREATFDEIKLIHGSTYACYFGLKPLERVSVADLNLSELRIPGLVQLECGGQGVDMDTYWNEEMTPDALRLAVGSVIQSVSSVARGQLLNCFAIVRPPGLHAEADQTDGFCFFNSLAIAAKVLTNRFHLKRVLIVDWDVHHGNGIQKAFYDDQKVLYISLHRHDGGAFFPGTGAPDEFGNGYGMGYNWNIAWSDGTMGDAEYLAAFRSIVMPIARDFDPSMVLVACGFDAASGHPQNFGGYNISAACFAVMTRQLMMLANGRLVLCLEGGFQLNVICECAEACLRTLLNDKEAPKLEDIAESELTRKPCHSAQLTLRSLGSIASKFWPSVERSSNSIDISILEASNID